MHIQTCGHDYDFLGSPEYYLRKKIIDDYYAPFKAIENQEKEENAELKRLKEKYGD